MYKKNSLKRRNIKNYEKVNKKKNCIFKIIKQTMPFQVIKSFMSKAESQYKIFHPNISQISSSYFFFIYIKFHIKKYTLFIPLNTCISNLI